MKNDDENTQVKSQNSLLYRLLTNEINPDESNKVNIENSNDVDDIYQLNRRYTFGTSEAKSVNKKKFAINEDIVEQTREKFDKLSTENYRIQRNTYKKKLAFLLPSSTSSLLTSRKLLPYSSKRKRTGDKIQPNENDYSSIEECDIEMVGRKRSNTLPNSLINQASKSYSSSKVILSSKCANSVLKFVVEQLKRISSFIIENRELYKISLQDLHKIIVRLLLLEIADNNLNFSVFICKSDFPSKRIVNLFDKNKMICKDAMNKGQITVEKENICSLKSITDNVEEFAIESPKLTFDVFDKFDIDSTFPNELITTYKNINESSDYLENISFLSPIDSHSESIGLDEDNFSNAKDTKHKNNNDDITDNNLNLQLSDLCFVQMSSSNSFNSSDLTAVLSNQNDINSSETSITYSDLPKKKKVPTATLR